jgi:uncharacterized membrane protein
VRDDREALTGILDEEAHWAKAANRARQEAQARQQWQATNREQFSSWLWAINAAGIVVLIYMYQRYGSSLRRRRDAIDSTPPEDMPPAVATYIFNAHQLTGGALVATLIDLANRGYLQLQQEQVTSRILGFASKRHEVTITFDKEKPRLADFGELSRAGSVLLPFERELLEFLQINLAQNRSRLGFREITKQSSQFHRFFRKWKKAIAAQAGNPKLYDPDSLRASLITFGVWLFIAAANVVGIYAMGETAIPFLIFSIILAPASFLILRYKKERAEQIDRLQAFRRYLKRFPQYYQKYGANWQQTEKFLIYGTALGLAGTEVKRLLEVVERTQGSHVFPWFIYSDGNTMGSLAPAMATLVDAASSTLSSASGADGGASAGGGGGAGGSGGGAG